MLKNLLKYEFKASSRAFGGCYLALLLSSVLVGFSMRGTAFGSVNTTVSVLAGIAYTGILAATFVLTFVTILRRFHNNLLGGEGYLMNTLPVRSWQLIAGKLIPAVVWSVASVLVACLSGLITFLTSDFLALAWLSQNAQQLFHEFFVQNNVSLFSFIVQIVLYSLLDCTCLICLIYLCLMLGHLFGRFHVPASIVSFFVIQNLVSFLSQALDRLMPASSITGASLMSQLLGASTFLSVVFGVLLTVVYFFAASWLLENRLNLE